MALDRLQTPLRREVLRFVDDRVKFALVRVEKCFSEVDPEVQHVGREPAAETDDRRSVSAGDKFGNVFTALFVERDISLVVALEIAESDNRVARALAVRARF